MVIPGGSAGKESICNAGDLGSIPRLGRSAGEGRGYPLQYSGLENSTDCTVHGGHKELDTTEQLHFHFSEIYIGQAGVRHLDVVVSQLLSHVQLFANPWTTACQASRALTISLSLLKLISIEFVMLSNHLILCHPLLLLSSIFASIRVFSNESAFCIRWPKYWSFSFNISPSNDYSGLTSFRIERKWKGNVWVGTHKFAFLSTSQVMLMPVR